MVAVGGGHHLRMSIGTGNYQRVSSVMPNSVSQGSARASSTRSGSAKPDGAKPDGAVRERLPVPPTGAFRWMAATLCGVLLAGCERLWESREVTVIVQSPLPVHCIESALDGVFGAGATRPNAQGTNFVVAAMPWEGYVRTHRMTAGRDVPGGRGANDSPDAAYEAGASHDSVAIDIELTRWNRYSRKEETLESLLARAQAAVMAACDRQNGQAQEQGRE